MALSARRYGRFYIPTSRYSDGAGKSGDLSELVKAYRPQNVTNESKLATLARVAATLQDPDSGSPAYHSRAASNVGVVGTNCSVVEGGDNFNHVSKITIGGTLAIAGAAAEAVGAKIYTFPAGGIVIDSCHMKAGVAGTGVVDGDANELGVGYVIGSGGNATLGAVGSGAENVILGQVGASAGVLIDKLALPTAAVPLVIEAADIHNLFFNVAATWTGADTLTLSGTIWVAWRFLGA